MAGWNTRARILLGALVAPLVPAALIAVLALAVTYPWDLQKLLQLLAVVGYFAALFVGWPAHLALQNIKTKSLIAYAGTGLLAGAVAYLVLTMLSGMLSGWEAIRLGPDSTLVMVLAGALCGLVASVAFWVLAIWQPGAKRAGYGSEEV